MLTYFWIMLGGALGTGARFWASGLVAERFGEVFPLGTLFVNISGSLVIGFFAGMIDPAGPFLIGPRLRQFVMIGICGGYTTFCPSVSRLWSWREMATGCAPGSILRFP